MARSTFAEGLRRIRRLYRPLASDYGRTLAHPIVSAAAYPQDNHDSATSRQRDRGTDGRSHGTHLDAPRHFIADGPSIDQIPLERLYGPGVVWRIDVADRGVIDTADLELATPRIQDGDIVLLDTGRARYINTEKYMDHASLTAEAAEWLVKRGAKIVGVDFATPDLAAKLRPPEFDFPVHYTLLSQGVLIAEHVTNLGSLAGQRAEIMFLGLNVAGSDGAQARVIARPLG